MINLKARKTHTIADNDTVESILGDAFKQTVDAFITKVSSSTDISREEFKDVTLLRIECFEGQLDHYRDEFHKELKNQLTNRLELTDHEYIQFGEVKHAHGIGNNCEYPIKIVTKTEIIDFGKLHSIKDIYCNMKYIRVADNDNQDLSPKCVKLVAALRG